MREVVLLQKIYGRVSSMKFQGFLEQLCEGLNVEFSGLSNENEWIKTKISGEDATVAARFLEREVGLAPIDVGNVTKFSTIRGRVKYSRLNKLQIWVDIGVLLPKPVYAVVTLQRLQGQLADGAKYALKLIIDVFGLIEKFPLEVRVIKAEEEEFKAEITERQLMLYRSWINSHLDRLLIFGEFKERVEQAIKKANMTRDTVGLEPLGVLEHALICKLGTDAIGLVSRLGRRLPGTRLKAFSPRRILRLAHGRW
ncbi:MAG: DUF2110 family protein [Candidatus Bathyarchaeota archaeon]|nr:MAG: DUF2110 family protein [Candidatus Bathyarchaeota archaeon]